MPNEYRRPRGIVTKKQIAGFELMMSGAVEDPVNGIAVVTNRGGVSLVNYDRGDCTCDSFSNSHPKVACEDIWAVRYFVEPPDAEEISMLKQQLAGELLKQDAERSLRASKDALMREDVALADKMQGIRGGYKRFGKAYADCITDELTDSIPFALALFEEIEEIYVWRRRERNRGRVPMRLSRLLLGAWIYTYFKCSVRAAEGFMQFLHSVDYIGDDYPDHATLSCFLRSEEAVPLIREVVAVTAEPFRDLGKLVLAADGTGAASSNNHFFDYRSQRCEGKEQTREGRPWWKADVVCGVDTLQTIAVRVTDKDASEKTVFREQLLPELEARDYEAEQLLLDGAYSDWRIRDQIITKLGAEPLIPWAKNSKNAVPKKWRNVASKLDLITELHRLCMNDPDGFKARGYNYRVKVENLFSAVKERFGSYVRTMTGHGPENEIALKFMAYNIHLLLMAAKMYGLDISGLRNREDDKAA